MRMVAVRCAKSAARRGFTLSEATAAVAILAVIAALAAPRFGGSFDRRRADGAASRLVAEIAAAQQVARRTGAPSRIEFDETEHRVTFLDLMDPDHPKNLYVIALAAEPYHARLAGVAFGGKNRLTFDGYGDPESPGTVTIAVGSESRTITIGADGGSALQP